MARGTVATSLVVAATMLAACGTSRPPPAVTDGRDAASAPAHQQPSSVATAEGTLDLGAAADPTADVIASAHGLELVLPADGALLVAFHEGSSSASELTVEVPARAVMNGSSQTEAAREVGVGDPQAMVLHVTGPSVELGDAVQAGETTIARGARPLDVGSQVDRFTVRSWREDPPPHVHLEVRPRR